MSHLLKRDIDPEEVVIAPSARPVLSITAVDASPPEDMSQETAGLVCLLICAVPLLHIDTLLSMLAIWLRSDTYTHGLFIFPISLYLIWRRRYDLARLKPAASIWGLLLLASTSGVWLLAKLANVLFMEQFAMVAMIPALIWAVLGSRIVLAILFPLAYLFFAVPMGDALIPHLMDFTAWFTVEALRLSGIPVYHEGFFISIPNGNFVVAEVCSGIRYLIASLALGSLYAYLTYSSAWRRAAFFGVAIVVPIIANGMRAYGIVLLGYLSDMRLGGGIDHFIYGWFFFGIVMFLMFWIGTFFRDDKPLWAPLGTARSFFTGASWQLPAPNQLMAIAATVLMLSSSLGLDWLRAPHASGLTGQGRVGPVLALPKAQSSWQGPVAVTDSWRPALRGADLELEGRYQQGAQGVQIFVAHYSRQNQGSELVSAQTRMYDGETWRLLQSGGDILDVSGTPEFRVITTRIRAGRRNRLVWHWFEIAGVNTASDIEAKLAEAWSQLSGRQGGSTLVAIAADDEYDPEVARKLLRSFLTAHFTTLQRCLTEGSAQTEVCAR